MVRKRDFDRRLRAAGARQLKRRNVPLRACLRLIIRRFPVPRSDAQAGFGNRLCLPSECKAALAGRPSILASIALLRQVQIVPPEADAHASEPHLDRPRCGAHVDRSAGGKPATGTPSPAAVAWNGRTWISGRRRVRIAAALPPTGRQYER